MSKGRIAGVTLEIDGSTTGLDKALKITESNISSVQRSLKDVNRLLKVDPKNTELLSQKQKLLSQAIEETKQKLEMEKEALRQAAEQDIPPDKMDALKREVIATTQELENLEKQAKNSSSILGVQMQEVGEKIEESGEKITDVGESLTKHVTAPIMAAGAAAGVAWKQVDDGMDIVIEKTGATGDALKEMQNIAKEIPQTINVGFDESGEAVGEVNTRFGVTGEKLKNLSVQFLEFSKLNKTDVSTSIDTTQKAMEAFNVSTDDAGAFLDTLNAVGQRTGADVIKLASDMTTNAAALKEMGFGASDAANFLGDLEVAGIDASTVMTGLKKALANAAAEGKPMDQALSEVQDAMSNATSSEEAMQYAMELFGTKAGPAIAEACANGQLAFNDLGTSIEDNLGNVETTFGNTQDPIDSFQTTLNTLKVIGADLANTLGQMLVPMLKELGTKAQELKAKWDGLSQGQQQMLVKLAGIAFLIGPLLISIGKVTTSVGSIIGLIGKLATFLTPAATGTAAVGTAATGAAGGVGLLSSGLLPIIGIIAGVVAAGVLLYKNWDTIKEKAGQLKENVTDKISSMKESVSSKYSEIKQNAKKTWDGMKQDTNATLSAMLSDYKSHGGGLKGAVSAALTGIKGVYSTKYNAIDSLTDGKLSKIAKTFDSKMGSAKKYVSKAIENIKSKFDFKWSLPELKLPHITTSGKFSINPPSVPKFSIKWYGKAMENAYILNGASIFGSMNGNLLGGGERGTEILMGEQYLIDMIKKASLQSNLDVIRAMNGIGNQLAGIMNKYFPEFAKQKVAIPERELRRFLRDMGVVFA